MGESTSEYRTMDQIIPNLWVGDFEAALDTELLEKHGIKYVLSAVQGIRVNKKFIQHKCDLLDTEYSDLFTFLPRAVSFIENALGKSEGVLVHCHAGMSRSASIAAAYLIKSQDMDVTAAIDLMKTARPIIQPNKGFLRQLEIFRSASYQIYPSYKPTHKYFIKRTIIDILDPSPFGGSKPSKMTVASAMDWRRIRCRKCRRELAARKHILQHGKTLVISGVPTTASPLVSDLVTSLEEKLDIGAGVVGGDTSTGVKITVGEMEQTGVPGLTTAVTSLVTTENSNAANASGDESGSKKAEIEDPLALTGPHDILPPSAPAPLVAGAAAAFTPSSQESLSGKIDTAPANALPLISAECSGYFLVPMAWMRSSIENGQSSGKIMCPNRKCSVKLGNFDWAGVRCGCEERVTPGFCLHRFKVDEIWK
ncbi:hypothetical protein BOTBODRAFT_191750 [Botryobasidium botryosum FD-172 SS1]|uniref:protein-tyrosine-phosphatase n=1 Tax=Botryobasidium botryosum (strain FD-172 SS1) TaxID=930990 RepID=A0A067LZ02_BOTB1|nr:hypothetical protein BOTBODRAFT_191750 [Botryobasidium botryosum FD-172 SS1]